MTLLLVGILTGIALAIGWAYLSIRAVHNSQWKRREVSDGQAQKVVFSRF